GYALHSLFEMSVYMAGAILPTPRGKRERANMGLQERFEKHWLGTVLLVAVVIAGGTWTVLNQVLVRPRDEELARLERRLEELDGKGRNTSPAPALKQGQVSAPSGVEGEALR